MAICPDSRLFFYYYQCKNLAVKNMIMLDNTQLLCRRQTCQSSWKSSNARSATPFRLFANTLDMLLVVASATTICTLGREISPQDHMGMGVHPSSENGSLSKVAVSIPGTLPGDQTAGSSQLFGAAQPKIQPMDRTRGQVNTMPPIWAGRVDRPCCRHRPRV